MINWQWDRTLWCYRYIPCLSRNAALAKSQLTYPIGLWERMRNLKKCVRVDIKKTVINEWRWKLCIESNHNHYIPVALLRTNGCYSHITSAKWYHIINHYIPVLWLGTVVSPINNWRKMVIFICFPHHKLQHNHEQTTVCCTKQNNKAAFFWRWYLLSPTCKDANRSRGRKNAEASHSLGHSILERFVKDLGEKEKVKSRIAFVLFGVVVWWFWT